MSEMVEWIKYNEDNPHTSSWMQNPNLLSEEFRYCYGKPLTDGFNSEGWKVERRLKHD